MGNKCVLENCNEDAFGFYPHCKKHLEQIKTGEIYKDEDGKWKEKNKKIELNDMKREFTVLPKTGFDKCLVCGNKTNGPAFCLDCYRENTNSDLLDILNSKYSNKKENVIDVNEDNDDSFDKENEVVVIDNENKSKCITCGRKTDGLLFCGSCYHKYKNKELYFKIVKCTDIELLDSNYEGQYVCKDGHVVKSKSEMLIDNYLFENNIAHAYERGLSYGSDKDEILHPDFYLKDYLGKGKDVYIEHWGYNENNVDYTKTKKFKIQKYKELGVTLVCTHEKTDMKEIDLTLDRKLKKENVEFGKINFENEND